jgi:tetratricopeptide (TPR) repeat protein
VAAEKNEQEGAAEESELPETDGEPVAARPRKKKVSRKAAAARGQKSSDADGEEGDADAESQEDAADGEDEGADDDSVNEGADEAGSDEASDAEAAAEAPVENRRERRRKKKRGDGADDGPRDRNARVREQIAKKRAAAEREPEPLTTSEMLDDAFARGTHAAGKWAKANASLIGYAVIALIVGGVGYGVWSWRSAGSAEVASTDLMAGVTADRGRVGEEPAAKQPDDEDPIPTFKTEQARAEAAIKAYEKARTDSPGSGTAILARLGEAGVLLDEHKWDEALAAYREVKGTPLAAADPDVRGRAIEGAAFAIEGKGDKDGALKAFKELDNITGEKGWKELSFYHQARLLAAKGEKEQALKLIKDAREHLQTTGELRNFAYLAGVLDELHRKLDPASAPRRNIGGGANQTMGADELMRMQQEMMRQLQKAKQDKHE